MSISFSDFWSEVEDDLGYTCRDMSRNRPYSGQPHTSLGERGATEVSGITFRDLRDCFIRAVLQSSYGISPEGLHEESCKGLDARLCENDLYGWDFGKLDPMAIAQNLGVEVEKIMGKYPNVPHSDEPF